MSWAKFDDEYDDNPKCRAAGKDGRALDQVGIRYCAKHRTNGLIPDHDLPLLAAKAEVVVKRTVNKLIAVDRWHGPGHDCEKCASRVDCPPGHYIVHDYLDYNPTAVAAEAKRKARAEAGRKGGKKSRPPGSKPEAPDEPNTEAIASANAQANGEANRNPVPVPPVVTSTNPSRRLSGRPPDEDDPETPASVRGAIDLLAQADLDARQQVPGIPPVGDTDSWLLEATTRRSERNTTRLIELALRDPDAGPSQLVAALNGEGEPDVTDPPSELELLSRLDGLERVLSAYSVDDLGDPPPDLLAERDELLDQLGRTPA